MRTLELKDICGYLPHDLCAEVDIDDKMEICKITVISNISIVLKTLHDKVFTGSVRRTFDEIKPILYPISSLYETGVHNGKEIIPIVECAKMAFPLGDWLINQYNTTNSLFSPQYGRFGFEKESFWVEDVDFVPNQVQLFDYLNELKIDCHGLIESGLAIDVNTLENNPYK
jgi:hypothetical protein